MPDNLRHLPNGNTFAIKYVSNFRCQNASDRRISLGVEALAYRRRFVYAR
jgi:hypothetical protein